MPQQPPPAAPGLLNTPAIHNASLLASAVALFAVCCYYRHCCHIAKTAIRVAPCSDANSELISSEAAVDMKAARKTSEVSKAKGGKAKPKKTKKSVRRKESKTKYVSLTATEEDRTLPHAKLEDDLFVTSL